MQIQHQEKEYCKYISTFESSLSEENMKIKSKEVLDVFSKLPVPGFRKNKKVSLDAIKSYYSKQIKETMIQAFSQDALQEIIEDKGFSLVSADKLECHLSKDKFSCTYELNVKPTFELKDLSSLEVPKPYLDDDYDQLIAQKLEILRRRNSTVVSFTEDDFVQEMDSIIVSYSCFINDELKEELSAEDEMMEVGSSKIKEFNSNLLGMKLGDTVKFCLQDKSAISPALKDSKVEFSVTLLAGSKSHPAPLDDDLAIKFGLTSLDELRSHVSQAVHSDIMLKTQQKINEAIGAKLLEMHDFKVPQFLLDAQVKTQSLMLGLSEDKLTDELKEQFYSRAEKSIRLSFILDAIRKEDPDANLTDSEVLELLRKHAATAGQSQAFERVLQQALTAGTLSLMFQQVRDTHTLESLSKNVTLLP